MANCGCARSAGRLPGLGGAALCVLAAAALVFGAVPAARPQSEPPSPGYVPETVEQLEQLVAPIALYPDSLLAEVLAASTYPAEIVEADRWVRAHLNLRGSALGDRVDGEPWDASVKALIGFPSVLGSMDRNLAWTSALGAAYYDQPRDVMAAVQAMRRKARAAGHLASTPEQTVAMEGSDIVIEPVSPDYVYVPEYDPWLIYGAPIVAWPGWYDYPGIWLGSSGVLFATGFSIGFAAGYAWGWHHWDCDWRDRYVSYDDDRFRPHGPVFFHGRNLYGGHRFAVPRRLRIAPRSGIVMQPRVAPRPFAVPRPIPAPHPFIVPRRIGTPHPFVAPRRIGTPRPFVAPRRVGTPHPFVTPRAGVPRVGGPLPGRIVR